MPDGFAADPGDCNDTDDGVFPGASEADCTDSVDYNCDGSVGYADADGDGSPACEDCNDSDGTINPNAIEICDGVDNNCDAAVDEAGALGGSNWYADTDGDGFGDADAATNSCDAPTDYVADSTDCDDTAVAVNPSATETCNDVDDDCNGLADEEASDAATWYADADGDGVGGAQFSVDACDQPAGYVTSSDDCDDLDASSYPSATEVCDGVDNDCDSALPTDESDGDADGYMACQDDCDDADDANHPGAPELCDTVDNDCNGHIDDGAIDEGTWYSDGDGFGHPVISQQGCDAPTSYVADNTDCDDTDSAKNPGRRERPGSGKDDDCDGISEAHLIYSVARFTGELWAVDYLTGNVEWTMGGLGEMIDVVTGPDGTIYVSVLDTGELVEVSADGTSSSVLATGFTGIHGLWYDYERDLILVTTSAGQISEVDPTDGTSVDIATGLSGTPIHTIRYEGDETLYTSFRADNMIRSFVPSSSIWTDLYTMPFGPNIMVPTYFGGTWVGGGAGQWLMYAGPNGNSQVLDVGENIYGICADPRGGDQLIFGDHNTSLHYLDPLARTTATLNDTLSDPWSCSTNVLIDGDDDGHVQMELGGPDCDDNDDAVNPDAADVFGNGRDENCDMSDGTDADGDGYSVDDTNSDCADPDDTDASVAPTTCLQASCLEIIAAGQDSGDGIYTIDTTGGDSSDAFDVYCDMTEDGGGWTLVIRLSDFDGGIDFTHDGAGWSNVSPYNTIQDISLTDVADPVDHVSTAYTQVAGDNLMIRARLTDYQYSLRTTDDFLAATPLWDYTSLPTQSSGGVACSTGLQYIAPTATGPNILLLSGDETADTEPAKIAVRGSCNGDSSTVHLGYRRSGHGDQEVYSQGNAWGNLQTAHVFVR